MRTVFFDLETGGLDPKSSPIIQVAAVAVDEAFKELAHIEMKLQFDEASATREALDANGYDPEVWRTSAIHPVNAQDRLSTFFKKYADFKMMSRKNKPYYVAQLAGHNVATFDGPFLIEWYKSTGAFMPAGFRMLDTYQLAGWIHLASLGERHAPKSLQLSDLMAHYGIERVGSAHEALSDVRGNVELARVMTRRYLNRPTWSGSEFRGEDAQATIDAAQQFDDNDEEPH